MILVPRGDVQPVAAAHFLGGFWAGGFFLWLSYLSGFTNTISRKLLHIYTFTLIFAFIVGVMWEVFELLSGATLIQSTVYTIDTAFDFLFDLLGAFAALLFFHLRGYYLEK